MISNNYFLQPGYIFVPDDLVTISTVIGSGVCVCLYDRKKQKGGMNHFLHPYMAEKGKTTASYGNIATIALIKMMLSNDSRKKDLEAQIFGGGYNCVISDTDIGKENIDMAQKILSKAKIPIISQDVGGERGRKVVFNLGTNEVAVLKVDRLRDIDWYPYQ